MANVFGEFPELLSQSEERKDEIVAELKMIHRNGFNLELDKYASNEKGSHAGKHAFLVKKLFGVMKLARIEQFLGETCSNSEDIFWHADVFKQGIEHNDSLNFEKCVEFIKNNPEMDFSFGDVVKKSGVNQKEFSRFLTDLVEKEIFIKAVDSYLWNSDKFEAQDREPKTEEEKSTEEKTAKVEPELTPEQKMEKARQMMANPKAAKKADKQQAEEPEKLMFGTDSYRIFCIEKRDLKTFEATVEIPLIEEINAYKSVTLLEKLVKSTTDKQLPTNTLKINSLILELTPENLKFEKWSDFTDLIILAKQQL